MSIVAFAECAQGRTVSVVWACRDLQRAINVAAGRDRTYIWDVERAMRPGTPDHVLYYILHPSVDYAWSIYYYLRDRPQLGRRAREDCHSSV